nr:CO(2)-response secreted protease-like [Ipomoea trifida]
MATKRRSSEQYPRQQGVTTVKRVATNVGPANAAYVSSIVAPKGLKVKVSPERIAFAEGRKKASFAVSFDGENASKGYNFGAILWSDGSHIVRRRKLKAGKSDVLASESLLHSATP